MIPVTGQHCEPGQHPDSPRGDDCLEGSDVAVGGEMERLEASAETPLGEVLQRGVQDGRLARLVWQENFGVGRDNFDAFTGTAEEEEEEKEGKEMGGQIKTWTQKHEVFLHAFML